MQVRAHFTCPNASVPLWQITGVLNWMVRSWTEVENNTVAVERVREYLRTPKEVANPLLTLPEGAEHLCKLMSNFSVPPEKHPVFPF